MLHGQLTQFGLRKSDDLEMFVGALVAGAEPCGDEMNHNGGQKNEAMKYWEAHRAKVRKRERAPKARF